MMLDLEALVRVYMNDVTHEHNLTNAQLLILRGQINNKLMDLEVLRGNAWDQKASTAQWVKENT